MADAAKIILTEGDAPSSVAAGTLDVYGKTDDKVYKKNSAGVEEMLLSGTTPALGVPTLGTLPTQNPPVDADLFIYRASAAAWALVTSTGTQIKAYLKTYFDTLYDATGTAAGKIAASISDGDTTHAPDGNSVFDALALKQAKTGDGLAITAGKTITCTEDTALDEAVAMSSKAPKASPVFTGTTTVEIINSFVYTGVVGTNTVVAALGNIINSQWLALVHDPNSVTTYNSSFIFGDLAGTLSVIKIGSSGDFSVAGFTVSGGNLQLTSDGGGANARVSVLRLR